MKSTTGLLGLLLLGWLPTAVQANDWFGELRLENLNRRLCGQLIDYTNHHGADRRIWSPALCQWRNLYVYLPPGYDPCRRYPALMWLHGYVETDQLVAARAIPLIDKGIVEGRVPPLIVIAPAGKIPGQSRGTMFINHQKGRYGDFIVQDVWGFVTSHYSVRPEREAHILVGLSTGGFGAFNLAIKNRDCFGIVAGLLPLLNMRWLDCHGRYRANFDPCCWGWRNEYTKDEILGLFYGLPLRLRKLVEPYFGWGPSAVAWVSQENPIEMLERCDVRPGDLAMYVAYVRKDQLNIDAAIESYLYVARQRGLCVHVDYQPNGGNHSAASALKFVPSMLDWLAQQLPP